MRCLERNQQLQHCMGVLAARDAHHDTIPRLNQVEIGNRFPYLPAESLAQFVELEAAFALIASPSCSVDLSLTAVMPSPGVISYHSQHKCCSIGSPEAASCNIPLIVPSLPPPQRVIATSTHTAGIGRHQ